jgi:lysyl-tRNA synthetase class 2
MKYILLCLLILLLVNVNSYRVNINSYSSHIRINTNSYINNHIATYLLASSTEPIVSPFDSSSSSSSTATSVEEELELTVDNVEKVLDEMRPYLQSDGGNVRLAEIDGPIVRLELQGACGTCPSSSMTMKMGLERRLKERIPEITEVVQSIPDAPALTNENIETVLDGVRPFLSVAGGKISIQSLTGVGGLQPVIVLKMDGTAASLQSVKIEIMQRIQRHFMTSLKIDWV